MVVPVDFKLDHREDMEPNHVQKQEKEKYLPHSDAAEPILVREREYVADEQEVKLEEPEEVDKLEQNLCAHEVNAVRHEVTRPWPKYDEEQHEHEERTADAFVVFVIVAEELENNAVDDLRAHVKAKHNKKCYEGRRNPTQCHDRERKFQMGE